METVNQQTLKLLGDKLYEKRKQAALEIERVVRELVKEKDHTKISALVDTLVTEYSLSSNSNFRNGGLIALAAIAIALGSAISYHLHQIVPPILSCFQDHDSRVRYYACESMYNVGKVARSLILDFFNEIFDALTKLSVDSELSVKNGAELLDRLIKDIVTEKSVYFHPEVKGDHPLDVQEPIFPPVPGTKPLQGISRSFFNMPRFIPLLTERIHVISAPGRLFLVQWIFVLNSVPDLELIAYLPEFLDGLFVYLSDPNVDVRTATLNVLGEFLKEISSIQTEKMNPENSQSGIELDFGKMTLSLVKYLSDVDEETKATALRWTISFITLAKKLMLPFTPMLLSTILPTLSHAVQTIRTLAIDANTNLFTLVLEMSTKDHTGDPFDIVNTVITLMQLCQDEHEDTRVGALEWLLMLHKKYPKQVMNSDQTLFQGLLKTLSDYSEEVVRRDLQLLAQISHSSDDEYFNKFMINLLNLFTIDRRLLETRGSLIIRQLCLSLNPERMYRSFGEILETEQDLEFASTMVQTLNLILITAPELGDMRKRLKNLESKEGSGLFYALYKSWCHNPIAVFSLCLLAQAYEHASNLMTGFGELDISVQFLIQTDKLVQLLESPVFTSLRLQLLEPEKYPFLYKCLYGILMLLPQSSAFATLRNRLNSVSSLVMLQQPSVIPVPASSTPKMYLALI
jgi:vacuole morphology and inheritance protein 14